VALNMPISTPEKSRRGAENRRKTPIEFLNRWKELAPDHTLTEIAEIMGKPASTLHNYAKLTGIKAKLGQRGGAREMVTSRQEICPVMKTLLTTAWTPPIKRKLASLAGKSLKGPKTPRDRTPRRLNVIASGDEGDDD